MARLRMRAKWFDELTEVRSAQAELGALTDALEPARLTLQDLEAKAADLEVVAAVGENENNIL